MATLTGTAYPSPAEIADHIRLRLSNRVVRVPSVRPGVAANPIALAVQLILIPTPAGTNSDMANPNEWLSPGQLDWAASQNAANNLPAGWLEQDLANRQRAGLTADPNYTMSNAEYDDAVEQTAVATDQVVANSSAQPTSGNVRITQVLTATLGACAALACQPPVGRFRGGAHGCTRQPPGDGLDSHHMPANSATAMPREMGPAIQMLPTDHQQTASYGGNANGAAYAPQRALTARGMTMAAFEMDVRDAQSIARDAGDPTRYDAAITQARAYALCLQAHGMLR